MTFGGDNFNDLPEIVPTREITTRIEKTFLVFSSVAVGLLLERAQCCSINSTQINPADYWCKKAMSQKQATPVLRIFNVISPLKPSRKFRTKDIIKAYRISSVKI